MSTALRQYVRRHDLRIAKIVYKRVVMPWYTLMSIPLFDITASMQYHYTWFRIPKNGTHSIMQLLSDTAPPEINSSYVPYFRRAHRDNFRFCIIRNPWDRLVSVYCNKVQMQLLYPECWERDFAYFIEFVSHLNLRKCDSHLRLQTAMFPLKDIDFVGRMEHFEPDMEHIMKQLGISGRIMHEGQVAHADYRQYYHEGLQERVRTLYAPDIEYGNYTF